MRLTALFLRYSFFAVAAICVNLAVQRCVFLFGESSGIFLLAIASGTGAGLIVKYLLDKTWIFGDLCSGLAAHRTKFSLYSAMGIITTILFWCTEATFWIIWQTEMMRDLGALIGLSIGYVVKYQLDKRYVFTDSKARAI